MKENYVFILFTNGGEKYKIKYQYINRVEY